MPPSLGPVASFLVVATLVAITPGAHAYEFHRTLRVGSRGDDVRELQIRVAGWFPNRTKTRMTVDKIFGQRTERAVKVFQRRFGLTVDGIAGPQTFAKLNALEDRDRSTKHFDWREFKQNRSRSCSAKANAYAGTFDGGMTSKWRTRGYARRLMWRLEALRRKAGRHPVGISSGFRSVAYNNCIGGARGSQHLYGIAADNRVARITNRRARDLARGSQFYGIACYSSHTHNHMDLRLENTVYTDGRSWWWPKRDKRGRDLTSDGSPCWGEKTTTSSQKSGGSHALVPSVAEIRRFEFAGETGDLGGRD